MSPINYKLYHPSWKAIRARILERAQNRCEQCGVPNYSVGARDRFGKWHNESDIDGMKSDDGEHLWPDGYPKIIRIILTCAHMNHDIADNSDENLKMLCQADHLAHDRDLHTANAKKTREKKAGLQSLFP